MLDFDLYQYYKNNQDHNIILTFKGALSQDILVEIGSIIKNKFFIEKSIKKIFAVFVELAQNTMHYSAEREVNFRDGNEVGVGIIIFSESTSQNNFIITSGNMIKSSQKDKIKAKLDLVNSLNLEEIKNQISEQRRKPQEDGSKGAGIGFLEIARKCNGKISYQLNQIDDEYYFLVLSVNFERGIE